MSKSALYICYFGLREPLVQTQVLPYLRYLAAARIRVHVLTFEPRKKADWSENQIAQESAQLKSEGIHWHALPYHKSPSMPATLFDILAGGIFAARLARREKLDILHARSHVPMAMALLAEKLVKVKLIFDIRGLMAEEYADSGIWTEASLPFRLVKKLERAGIGRADQVVVLTNRMRDWLVNARLKSAGQIEVIPCCVDLQRFGRDTEDDSTLKSGFEVVYAGSLMGLYLVEEMGQFFKAIKALRPDAFLRILSVSPSEQGERALERAGVNRTDFEIKAVRPAEVPGYLKRARLGLSFRKAAFAQIAASPTKIPEYLAVGVPVVCNAGIGDVDDLLERERVGVLLRGFSDDDYRSAAAKAILLAEDPEIGERSRRVAHANFDFDTVGGPGYLNVYDRVEGLED